MELLRSMLFVPALQPRFFDKAHERGADALILDTRTDEKIGGTGIPHDWNISAEIVAGSAIPVILAGGLTPENVREAIFQARPAGVDVCLHIKSPF